MALLVFLVVFAVYRITRLLTADSFPPLQSAREAIQHRYGPESWQAYLSECPWCVSVWIGGAVVLAVDLLVSGGLVAPLLVWPVASGMTGLIVANLDPAE